MIALLPWTFDTAIEYRPPRAAAIVLNSGSDVANATRVTPTKLDPRPVCSANWSAVSETAMPATRMTSP